MVGAMLLPNTVHDDDITKWAAHTPPFPPPRGYVPGRHPERLLTSAPASSPTFRNSCSTPRWRPVSDKVLKSVTAKTAVHRRHPRRLLRRRGGQGHPRITDSHGHARPQDMPDADVYKITKAIVV